MHSLMSKGLDLKSCYTKSPTKARRACIVVGIVAFVLFAIWYDMQPVLQYVREKERIEVLVPIGSDIDDADGALTNAGFRFFEKEFATVDKDYYVIQVRLHYKRRSTIADMLSYVNVYLYYNYVVIEATLDNKVRKVY